MIFLRKNRINFKYIFKNFFTSPIILIKEILADMRKDYGKKIFYNNVWICGLPKSGTTLIEKILDSLPYVSMDRSPLRCTINKDLINVNNIQNFINFFPKKKNSFIKTHLEYDKKLLEVLKKNNFKIIITFRNLKDVMISRYYHVLSDKKHRHHNLVKNCSFEEGFLNSIKAVNKDNLSVLKHYFFWVEGWSQIKEEDNLLKIDYEKYSENPYKFIKKILFFLDLKFFDEKKIEEKLEIERKKNKELSLTKKLKSFNRNVSTFRSGKTNQWKKLFNNKIEAEFNKILHQ